ncbi:MAG: fructose-1,6-bisphosphatase [Ardenticatenaceae bacterium]|nr:fructose-1,6-bisphosphatase [Ardenticatenaceae bacterium]
MALPAPHEPDLNYLRLLAKQYPTIQAAATEIINLNANLNLPKGTEHFLSDLHGEYEPFLHVLKNGSGSIKRRIDELFANQLAEIDRQNLATLIYYPEQKLSLMLSQVDDTAEWYRIILFRLIKLCRAVSSKYTRAALREALPDDFAYIIEELLQEQESVLNKQAYYQSLINTVIETGQARAFIVAMAELIQRLAIAHLHIIGDVYDRGPGAHIIMDTLLNYHSVDIQWGNHDIVWMGAAAGSEACIANVIRICLRYANLDTLQDGYAISMLPLASFAVEVYGDSSDQRFCPKVSGPEEYTENELRLLSQMHKAITVIQLKLEAAIIQRNPDYRMADRLLLHLVDYEKGTICLHGQEYPLLDAHFPTIDPERPYSLTDGEQALVDRLKLMFMNSERLQRHVRFLFNNGSMYLIYNGNLLYHGCIPMTRKGAFVEYRVGGQQLTARSFMDQVERLARQGYFADDAALRQEGQDAIWYLWSGPQSPLFGKDKMATFERYFIADRSTHQEEKNAYYDFRDEEETAVRILEAFGMDATTAHIINGHVPVKVKRGESPIKAGGKLFVIDGGLSKAYQEQTGIAGYTLIFNSYGLLLASHEPFASMQKAIEEAIDIHSHTEILETNTRRIFVRDTDAGCQMQRHIDELQALLRAYRAGLIKEN